jgi:hypothetical protein
MSTWVNLNINTEDLKVEKVLEDGMIVFASPSPYDVPGSIKAEFDDKTRELRIHFSYIGTEPVRQEPSGDQFSFGLGVNSGRLYEIDVQLKQDEVESFDVGTLVETISGRIDSLQQSASLEGNYNLAKTALHQAEVPIGSAIGPNLIKAG